MKRLKHILCTVNLIFFLSSFTLLSLAALSGNGTNNSLDFKHLVISAKHNTVNNNVLQLSEENETENDGDFEAQALVLPFIFSGIASYFSYCTYSLHQTFSEAKVDPIYLKVCNFRV